MRKVSILLFLVLIILPAILGQFPFTTIAQTPTQICNASYGATWYGQVYVQGDLKTADSAGNCLIGIGGQALTSDYMYKTYWPDGTCHYSDYYGQGTTNNYGHYYFQYGPWGAPKVLSIEVNYAGNSQYQSAHWIQSDINPSDWCPLGS
jgi:hypothetical protein